MGTLSLVFDGDAKRRVLDQVYLKGPNMVLCAKVAGVKAAELHGYLKHDETFREQFDIAKAEYHQKMEDEAYRRAVTGVREHVYNKDGDIVGEKLVYSDRMLEIILKANMPEKYREQSHVAGIAGQGSPGGVLLIPVKMANDEDLAAKLAELTLLQEKLREDNMKDITPVTKKDRR